MKRRIIRSVQRDIRRPVKNGVNAQRPAVQQGDAGLSGHLQAGQLRGGQTGARLGVVEVGEGLGATAGELVV